MWITDCPGLALVLSRVHKGQVQMCGGDAYSLTCGGNLFLEPPESEVAAVMGGVRYQLAVGNGFAAWRPMELALQGHGLSFLKMEMCVQMLL